MKDKLQFFNNSAHKNAGKGIGEQVKKYDKYTKLNEIKDWRKKLCNNLPTEFTTMNQDWNSVDNFLNSMEDKIYPEYKNKLLTVALFAKFSQNNDLKKLLLLTGDSNLFLYNKKTPVLQTELMTIRKCIRSYDKFYDLKKISNFSYILISKILNIKLKTYKFQVNDKVIFKSYTGYIDAINYQAGYDTTYHVIFENGKNIDFITGDKLIPKIIFNKRNGIISSINYGLDKNTYNIKLNDGEAFKNVSEDKIIRDKIKLIQPSDESIFQSIKYTFPWMKDDDIINKVPEYKKN